MHISIELLLNLVPGLILGLMGWISLRKPPAKINTTYGFRTRLSMQSQEAWDFANAISPKLMLKSAAFLLAIGLAVSFILPVEIAQIVVYVLMIVFTLLDVRRVNNALKEHFGNDGRGA